MDHPSIIEAKRRNQNQIYEKEMKRRNTYRVKSAKDIYYKQLLKPKKSR